MKLKIKTKFKFNHGQVLSAASRAKRSVMIRSGAILRGIMRRKLRRRKKKSEPGQPPNVHSDGFGLKNIEYHYNPRDDSVIVGPVQGGKTPGQGIAGILEYGGRSTSRTPNRVRRRTGKNSQTVKVRPRPFSNPSLESFADDFPDLWRDVIK